MNGTYEKTSAGDNFKGDQYGDGGVKPAGSGTASGGGSSTSGPTGSSRAYPKGTRLNLDAGRMNPQKTPVTDIYVGGVD